MAKFYVQSGTLRAVVEADEVQKAGLWAVHRAMRQIVPIYDDDELSPQQKCDAVAVEGMLVLGDAIRVSERGFDRDDATRLETFAMVSHWHQLMTALDRLERMLAGTAGEAE